MRLTLGARASHVLRLFGRQTLMLVTSGPLIGVSAGLMSTPLLASFLGDVNPRDPLTFAIGGLILMTVAPSVVPARRAMRVDPAITLRTD